MKTTHLTLAALALCTAAATAAPQKIYFNQQGRPTDQPATYAYVREYTPEGASARVQDFYYPSRRKYSDPYRTALTQIRQFVPKLDNGTLTLWHLNGRTKMHAPYRNGKPDGEWTNWYNNGGKSAVMPYKNGQTEGTGARYYPNGRKESEIEFHADKANGKWKQWYPDGSPKSEVLMKNDEPAEMVSWDEKGRLTAELTFTGKKRSGIMLEWHDNGAKKSESVYHDDELVSRTVWDENGLIADQY